ncbi:MAG: hypothetical protein JWR16_245 [Nevskia sp.]|nr:hypothetical protein [Nevskia sp.]
MAFNNPSPDSSNPAWKALRKNGAAIPAGDAITRNDIVMRTAFLLLACLGGVAFGWLGAQNGLIAPQQTGMVLIGSAVAYIALGLVIAFKPLMAQWLATPAVTLEGVALGLLTLQFDTRYHGIGTQALLATLLVAGVTWGAYAGGLIKPGPRFMKIVMVATLSAFLLYAADLLMMWLLPSSPLSALTRGNGMLGIGFSLLMVGLASMNLIADYLQADTLVQQRAPKALAWYSAWAMMVTLIWLYMEMLRLLAKINSRR